MKKNMRSVELYIEKVSNEERPQRGAEVLEN
ncbi:hypothetical protein B878_07670 [Vibrio campbellii CAIM 519 = NBRC 15631 = ATCC 25920]|nr:hypothetical protein B878_07670 [Vibrio campbellii CAIM 519 = NBRC 15631 = ATCC 25920]